MNDPTKPDISSDLEPDWLRHSKHFPIESDMTLQILKGHLLVEELLREIFILLLAFPETLRGNRGTSFECHQIICLVQSMSPYSDKEPWLWDAAKRLNVIRNDLAHNLEPKSLGAKVQSLIEFVNQNETVKKVVAKNGVPEGREFEAIILAMCGGLSGLKGIIQGTHPKLPA